MLSVILFLLIASAFALLAAFGLAWGEWLYAAGGVLLLYLWSLGQTALAACWHADAEYWREMFYDKGRGRRSDPR